MGLAAEKKLQVVQLVLDNDYDLEPANVLREQFRRERYFNLMYIHLLQLYYGLFRYPG